MEDKDDVAASKSVKQKVVAGSKLKRKKPRSVAELYCEMPNCDYRSNRSSNLVRHIESMHTTGEFLCCSTVFTTKAHFRQHRNIEHKQGYMCRQCSRCFTRNSLLQRHMSVHSGKRDYHCKKCLNYSSSHKNNVDRHMARVHRPLKSTTTTTTTNDTDSVLSDRASSVGILSSSSSSSTGGDSNIENNASTINDAKRIGLSPDVVLDHSPPHQLSSAWRQSVQRDEKELDAALSLILLNKDNLVPVSAVQDKDNLVPLPAVQEEVLIGHDQLDVSVFLTT